jgi:hypothetical protein
MEESAMTLVRHVVVVAGLLGLCAIGIVTHGGRPIVPSRDGGVWTAHLRVVEAELARGHVDAAVRVWHDAHGAALESRSWESMIAVGDAFMKIGHAAGTPGGARMNARDAYLTALIRARRNGSVDGAIRSAEAFRRLGARAIVEQCLHIAAQLAAGDDRAQQKVREARERWEASSMIAGSLRRRARERDGGRAQAGPPDRPSPSSSSRALASARSAVSNPSVNQA